MVPIVMGRRHQCHDGADVLRGLPDDVARPLPHRVIRTAADHADHHGLAGRVVDSTAILQAIWGGSMLAMCLTIQ